jgi:Prokaryotic membrane lipoprotein lipid attachment site
MRRPVLAILALIALAGCSSQQQRPEGIVERWLLALNQGSAGEPGRYAPAEVSNSVLPGWETLDPGELDVIEVARALPCTYRGPARCRAVVPFRVVSLDGDEIRFDALVGFDPGARHGLSTRVFAVAESSVGPVFPSEGGPTISDDAAMAWLIAAGIGLAILLASEAVMRLVRSTASD